MPQEWWGASIPALIAGELQLLLACVEADIADYTIELVRLTTKDTNIDGSDLDLSVFFSESDEMQCTGPRSGKHLLGKQPNVRNRKQQMCLKRYFLV